MFIFFLSIVIFGQVNFSFGQVKIWKLWFYLPEGQVRKKVSDGALPFKGEVQ